MGLFDKLKEKKDEMIKEKQGLGAESEGKYGNEACALCGYGPAEKKWAGQYWHKACMRKAKKSAKKMV
ncbi:MAG: hypothetical protein ABH821_03385 [archaeon]